MHQPGANYTDAGGMDVLGCVVERASGIRFDKFLEEKIFNPLNMKDTFFSVPESKRDRFTTLYAEVKDLRRYFPELDERLPKDLTIGLDDYIPKMTYHRVIKDINELVVRLENI